MKGGPKRGGRDICRHLPYRVSFLVKFRFLVKGLGLVTSEKFN